MHSEEDETGAPDVRWVGSNCLQLRSPHEGALVNRSRPETDEDSPLCGTVNVIECYRICGSTWHDQCSMDLKYNGRWTPCLSRVSHRGGLTDSPLDVQGQLVGDSIGVREEPMWWESLLVFHACSLSEKDHIHGYARSNALRCVRGTGVHQDTGYVPPGARTEKVSELIIPRGLRCEEIEVPGRNGHSLSGVFVSSSVASRAASRSSANPSDSPETLFFYLQGSNSSRHLWGVLTE